MTAPAAQPTHFDLFLPFSKVAQQDDGTLLVHSLVNDETLDDQGEIVTYDAVEKASGAFMEWGNVREMHDDHTAAGTVLSLARDVAAGTHEAIVHVVDPGAVKKVLSKVYKGTSLGGFKTQVQLSKVDGKPVRKVTGIDWRELSLVDRPSRPTATLTLLKRSDGDAPAPALVEETTEEEPTVTTPAEPIPAAVVAAPAAPEAGEDVFVAADGAEVPKPEDDATVATEPVEVEKVSSVPRGTAAPLAKAAADDARDASWILADINRLIETEAGEGDTEGVTQLKAAQTALLAFLAAESAEVGTPADIAEEAAEALDAPIEVVIVGSMAYGSKTGDLQKISIPASALEPLIEQALAKRAALAAAPATPENPPADPAKVLAKATAFLNDHSRFVSPADLQAMKVEILGAIAPVSEGLAKIARMPVPGGPARYGVDTSRLDGEDDSSPATEAEVLSKAAQATSDPHVREELGRLAAAAQISAGRRR